MLKQFAQQSVNRKVQGFEARMLYSPALHLSRLTFYGSAALLTDQSLCKDTFGSSTHLVDDLTGKEQNDAAQD